ncbi:MAG: S-layer homology domain-containing protein [Bacillota bacterium]|nr:S-layer homology domain-containing protein [Bacillota bacterium]
MKKIISFILVLAMMFGAVAPCYAAWSPEETQAILEIQETLETINKSVDKIATGSKDVVSALTTAFDVAGKMGTVLCVVNGSVTFLRLIGVMEDPTAKALADIQAQLETIDDKLTNMNATLNNIAGDITKLIATTEFNERGRKAMDLQKNWSDFAYRYMETGLDKLISQFQVLLIQGMKAWCNNIPKEDVKVYYGLIDGELSTIYGDVNTVDAAASITFGKDAFPSSISWNVNTYLEQIQGIFETALRDPNLAVASGIEITEDNIEKLAIDAANQIVYEVTVDAVNDNTQFVYDVRDAFKNYCMHLLSNENDGVYAMLNSMYLTHAFQYQIKDDINEFFDQMIVKTGTYGMFASDILGMTNDVSDSDKIFAMETLCEAIEALKYKKEHAIVGYNKEGVDSENDRFCYITNSLIYYTDAEFRSDLTAKTTEWRGAFGIDYRRYESVDSTDIEFRFINGGVPSNASLIGDTNALMLLYTLQSNGIVANHDYFKRNICPSSCSDRGELVTSYTNMPTVPNDSSIHYVLMHVIGNWFPDKKTDVTLNHLPGDTETKYIREKKGVQGSVLTTDGSTDIRVNVPLHTVAIYAEGHGKWTKDEIGFLVGPYTEDFEGFYYNPKAKDGEDCTYTCATWHNYNVLAQAPVKEQSSNDWNMYGDPIDQYLDIVAGIHEEYGNADESRPLLMAPVLMNPSGFRDVKAGSWYEDDVIYCVDKELMKGVSKYFFAPNEKTTRSQVVTILYRLAGEPAFMNDNIFSDVVADSWYEKAVVWANGKNIVDGVGNDKFAPDKLITREELVTMLYRFAQYMEYDVSIGEETNILSYNDAFTIHDFAMQAFQWACGSEVLNGSNGTLMPTGLATRAELAAVIHRFVKLSAEK